MNPYRLLLVFFLTLVLFSCSEPKITGSFEFNDDWEFVRDVDTIITANLFQSGDAGGPDWQTVSLPHTAFVEPLVITGDQWQGYAFYRKFFTLPEGSQGQHIAIEIGAAMQVAEIWLNGTYLMTHHGGYLPAYIDLTGLVADHPAVNVLLVRLNNLDNPQVPPGKPIKTLDFNYFSGIYRTARLLVKNPVHISDPLAANRVAGGGIRIHYEEVSDASATMVVQTDIYNMSAVDEEVTVHLSLVDREGNEAISSVSEPVVVYGAGYQQVRQEMKIENPSLWSPDLPYLYTLNIKVDQSGRILDQTSMKAGIRTFRFTADGFELNGKKLWLRGTNRHQEYPYIGYALSDEAQYRDAYKIKQAGFNFVRLSHYPHSLAFMEACDELGLMTMDAIPGWQFFGDSIFQERSIMDVRNMVRRSRNHPSVILWESSLNESGMTEDFIDRAHGAVHEELPEGDVYTCGWMDYGYDVFVPARQHGQPPRYWNDYDTGKPILIAEYGDWEYYAQNAGFNQTEFSDLKTEERNSRQLRGFGPVRLAQQALNYQDAHNSNLNGMAAGDANWLMFDYNRGYAPDLEASGISDIFRIPKFAYYFYQSQAGPDLAQEAEFGKPMVFIANYWDTPEWTDVKVYSNGDEVELLLNGQVVARQKPDTDRYSTNLVHPPFTFQIPKYEPGTLTARAYIGDQIVAETKRTTPGKAARLELNWDRSGRDLATGSIDVVFVYATVVDEAGNPVHSDNRPVVFEVEGDAELIGHNPIEAEAGIATILLKTGNTPGPIKITARAVEVQDGILKIE